MPSRWTRAEGGGWWLKVPFDEDFVSDLKDGARPRHRRWDRDCRRWWISDDYIRDARRLVDDYYGPEFYSEARQAAPAGNRMADQYATLHLLPSAPAELVKAAYRTLSLLYHPDRRGGDHNKMVALNLAYEVLKAG